MHEVLHNDYFWLAVAFIGVVGAAASMGVFSSEVILRPTPKPFREDMHLFYVSIDREAIDRNAKGDTLEPVMCIQDDGDPDKGVLPINLLVDSVTFDGIAKLVYDPYHQRFPNDPEADTAWVECTHLRYVLNGVTFNLP